MGGLDTASPGRGLAPAGALTQLLLLLPLDELLLVELRLLDPRLAVERPDVDRELAARRLVERLPAERVRAPLELAFASCF